MTIETAYERYYHKLAKFAFRFSRDKDEAEDLTSRMFARLLEKPDYYILDDTKNVYSWLMARLRMVVAESYRMDRPEGYQRAHSTVFSLLDSVGESCHDDATEALSFIDTIPAPEPPTDSDERLREIVNLALSTLSKKTRYVVVLKVYGGLEYSDIAEFLGLGIPAVKKRWQDALRTLEVEFQSVGIEALSSVENRLNG